MKIKKLKINAFGNIAEKEIEFGDHINIIQGENESGKSTILKFIANIFYGASKNKKGKEFSDYDRYKPWQKEEFSGKLTYCLEEGKQYEVFRDFNKKNPIIYNEQYEDISKEFSIDKNYGNQFFVEQTQIEENMFYSCLVSMQQEVKLEQNIQNALVQKVANLAGTGDDRISYQKAMEKINKKQIEEIGTTRSQGRPINLLKEEKFKWQDEMGELEELKERKKQIEKEKEEKKIQLAKIEEILKVVKQIKMQKEQEKLEQEKMKISEDLQIRQEEKKKELEQEKEKLKKEQEKVREKKEQITLKKRKGKNISIIFLILGILLEVVTYFILKNKIAMFAFLILILASLSWFLWETKKEKQNKKKIEEERQKEKQEKQEIQKQLEQIETEINILQKNKEEQQKEIEERKERIRLKQNLEKEKLKQEGKETETIEKLFSSSNIQEELEKIEEERNSQKLAYHSLELEENNMVSKLEKGALIEEKLQELKEKEEELEKRNEAMELAKEILEIAYQKMKQTITPKLTQELSKNIQKITNGKYAKISLQEEKGMIVEKENGEYIEIEKLSIGTIDQLYLSLRLAMLKELAKEPMPILLDETFAYYDEQRLENILKYLHTEFAENQIIIFTCTNREKEILNKWQVEYQNIEL